MSTTRKIAHNTLIQIIGKGVSTALGLFAIGMMTRYLGQEQFGWYVTAISFLQFVGIVTDFGLIPVTAQMMNDPKYDQEKLFHNLLGFRIVSSILFIGLAPAVALLFPYPSEVKVGIALASISFIAIAINQVLTGFYQTKLAMHHQVIGETLGRIVLVVGLWLLIQKQASFFPIMALISISSVCYTIYMWVRARYLTSLRLAFDWSMWKAIMIKMWPIAVGIMFNVIYLKGDILILSWFRPQDVVGIYGAAYRVIDVLSQMAMILMGIMLPVLTFSWTRNLLNDFKKQYQLSIDTMALFVMPLIVGGLLLAEPIMTFVAGPEFREAATPLRILLLAILGVFVGAIYGHLAVAIDKQKTTMWIYITSSILTLIGYLLFIPRFGMLGAAWMSVFSELYVGILLFIVVKKCLTVPMSLRKVGKVLLASLIMGAVLVLAPDWHMLILLVTGAIVYAALLYALKVLTKDTLKEIFGRAKPSNPESIYETKLN